MERIITIEVEGPACLQACLQAKLGFDTGLNAHSFAQAKLASFITRSGMLVYPDGRFEVWKPEGAAEHQTAGCTAKSMVIYGPAFSGVRLDRCLEGADDCALDALRRWILARLVLNRIARDGAPDGWELPAPWPAAALLSVESPGAGVLGAEVPGTKVPDTEALGAKVPDTEALGAGVPDTEALGAGVPDTGVPGAGVLGTGVPGAKVPDTKALGTEALGAGVPGAEALGAEVPGTEVLGAGVPDTKVPSAFPPGTLLFPPDVLVRRALEAEGNGAWLQGAERWTHPDRTGEDADVFAAAAMLYRVVCGAPPYSVNDNDIERLHSDIREGVYTPPALMTPGLDPGIAALITGALAPAPAAVKKPPVKRPSGKEPSLEDFRQIIGPLFSGGPERFFRQTGEEERARTAAERKQFDRKKAASVKRRRFIRRNTTIIGGLFIALTVLALVTGSIVKGRADRPTTRGMSPREVIAVYYGSFETLDHILMEACVTGKAGKGDITAVANIFVIGKVREAYEMKRPVVSAREWLNAGAAPTDLMVAGVTDLRIEGLDEDESDGEVRYRADYTLYLPAGYAQDAGAGDSPETPPESALAPPALPAKTGITDEVRLILRKGAWRIAEIDRKANSYR